MVLLTVLPLTASNHKFQENEPETRLISLENVL